MRVNVRKDSFMNKKRILVIALILMTIVAGVVFAADVKPGKYVAGDSRNDLDYDYWILLNSNGTVGIHAPGGAASGTWSYDGYEITIRITSAQGELADARGQTITFRHADATGTVIIGEGDAWWLQ
jgi:hypothetical protein